jgi:hypothetical protein
VALLAAPAAHAEIETLTYTIGASSLNDPGVYPTELTIGNFGNSALDQYDTIVGATVAGQFGYNALSPTTAAGIFSVGASEVFVCNDGDDCWGGSVETPWAYTFTADEYADLANGNTAFTVQQTDFGQIQTDVTTLTLEISVPEPATIALFGASLLGMGMLLRRNRA